MMSAFALKLGITVTSSPGFILGADTGSGLSVSVLEYLSAYAPVFVVAFLVTLLITPLIRRIAIAYNVVDHPDAKRKAHAYPVAYMGGLAVFFGLIVAIGLSYVMFDSVTASSRQVPFAIIIGMIAITFTGLADDIWGWDPRLKIAGQLVAAAALAVEEVGVLVAKGVLLPVAGWLDPVLGCRDLIFVIPTPMGEIQFDTIYWVGTALIALFVLGGCNASNLIDGLDGLLSGVSGIVAVGLLVICLLMVVQEKIPSNDVLAIEGRVQQQAETYHQDKGYYPASLEVLVDQKYLDKLPHMPEGWTPLHYNSDTGVVDADIIVEVVDTKVDSLQSQIDRYNEVKGHYPRVPEVMVSEGFVTSLPEFPEGWSTRYDRGNGLLTVQGPLTGARIILCMALLGAVLGFLPHNFNPATIFLGDCGSLLLGYMCVVIILMLGERGQTHLVFAGLIVFSIPIMDTILAIIRRKLAGASMSDADDQHIHHQLKRSLGGVKQAVFALYGIGIVFAVVGVSLAALVMFTELRIRAIYAIAIVLFGFIGVIAVKAARRQQLMAAIPAVKSGKSIAQKLETATPAVLVKREGDPNIADESALPPQKQNGQPDSERTPHTKPDPESRQNPHP